MSWKDEEFSEADAIDEYGAEPEVLESCLRSETEWVDAQRAVHTIKHMELRHLKNCICGIEKGKPYFGQAWKLDILKAEVMKRDAIAKAKVEQLEAINAELLEAAEAVVTRWDSPLWKDQPHTGTFIDQLRAAIVNAKERRYE